MSYTRYVMIAQPRTGSTLMNLLLASHPNVLSFGEILHPAEETRRDNSVRSRIPVLTLDDDIIEYLENYVYKEYPDSITAVGFKLFYDHARNPEWSPVREYLRDTQVRVIHLKRKNLLDRYLSFELAMRSNVWVDLKDKNNAPNQPITLDPKKCFQNFHKTKWFEGETDDFFKDNPKLEVIYEELANDPDRNSRRILDFLKVDHQELTSKTRKQQTKNKAEVIANYDELKQLLIRALSNGQEWAKEEWLDFFDEE